MVCVSTEGGCLLQGLGATEAALQLECMIYRMNLEDMTNCRKVGEK